MYIRASLATVSLSMLCVFGAAANADAEASDDSKTLDAIQVTGSKRAEQTRNVPVAVTVKSRKELDRSTAQTAADLLHGEAGTFVQQTTPGQGVVIVRGLKGSEVLHLVDGFRLNNAFFRNAPNQYPALIDPLSIEQLEVVRGPSSVLYGSDAMGGVVQALTREPRFDGADWQFQGEWKSRYGSADNSTINRVALQTGREGFAMQLGASYQDVQSLRVGGGDELPFTDYTARYGDFALNWDLSDVHAIALKAQYARQPKTPRFDELTPGFGQTNPTSAEFLFKPQERYFGLIRYNNSAETTAFDRFSVTLGRQDIVDGRLNRDFGSNNRDTESSRSELLGLQAQFEKTLGLAYWTYGFERYEDEISSERNRVNIATNAVSVRAPRFPNGSTMDSLGAFVALDYALSDRWDIQTGLRHSRFDIDLPPVPGVGLGVAIEPSKTTGNFGVRYSLTPSVNWVSNIGRGFRAPNVFDLGTLGARPGNRFNEPNGELRPEVNDSIDTGLKWGLARWQGEFFVYKSRYKNKITSVETGALTSAGQLVVRNANATKLDLYGVEFSTRYAFNAALQGFLTGTLTRGTEQLGAFEDNADRIPPVFGKLGVDFQLNEQVAVSAYSRFANAQQRLSARDLTDPRINPNGTAGWTTLNLRADWQALPQLQVGMSLENLADKRYREHGTGLDEPGRNLGLSLDWQF